MKTLITSLVLAVAGVSFVPAQAESVWLEAESLSNHGGWMIDTQFIDIMGSPYLLAHGMGRPVKDAGGQVTVKAAGSYKVWVRSKNWVGPWDAPGAPGRRARSRPPRRADW